MTAEQITVTHAGVRYRVERRPGPQRGTETLLFPGIGLVGSERAWLGTHYAKVSTWWAARNPTGEPGEATARTDRLTSRRAAIAWLLAQPAGASQ